MFVVMAVAVARSVKTKSKELTEEQDKKRRQRSMIEHRRNTSQPRSFIQQMERISGSERVQTDPDVAFLPLGQVCNVPAAEHIMQTVHGGAGLILVLLLAYYYENIIFIYQRAVHSPPTFINLT